MSTEPQPSWSEPVPDGYLWALERLAALDDQNTIPLTLWAGGGIVYGDLISYNAWKTAWEASMTAFARGTGVELLANLPKTLEEGLDAVLAEVGEERKNDGMPRFLHFRNVKLVGGSHATSCEVSLWRCRLTDISGWSIGRP